MTTAVATSNDTVLGQLVVRLVGDNADFLKRFNESEKRMKEFTARAQNHFRTIAKAGTIAVGAVTGVAFAVSRMASGATQIRSLSQSLGLASSEFLEVSHAARQTGVTTETLLATFTRLNTIISQANTQAVTPMRAAIDALGVSLTNADGSLRSNIDVFEDLADKFAGFSDNAQKSALAVQLFGEQGVKLLPLLNQGKEGLGKFADEARRLGIVLSDETVDQASQVDKEFKLLGDTMKSAGIKIAAEFLPALRNLSDLITDSGFVHGIAAVAGKISSITDDMRMAHNLAGRGFSGWNIDEVRGLIRALDTQSSVQKELLTEQESVLSLLKEGTHEYDAQVVRIQQSKKEIEAIAELIAEIRKGNLDIPLLKDQIAASQNLGGFIGGFGQGNIDAFGKKQAPVIDLEAQQRLEEITNAAKAAQQAALQELLDTPTETAVAKLEALTEALHAGTISWQEFGQMAKWVGKEQEQVMDDLLSTTATTLTSIFKENKIAATASALINTYQAITKALSAYPPPYNMAMAAMVAAQGFAQVQAIRNTNKNGGGGGSAGVGSGGSSGGTGGGGGDEGGSNVPRSLFVQGINPRELYSGAVVADLAEVLLQFQRDGGTVLLDRKNS